MFQKNFDALNKLQDNAVETLFSEKRIVLEWETGVGKTLPALKSAARGGKWLWCMTQNIQEANVKKEIAAFNLNVDITFCNYKSAYKYEKTPFTGIILDEAHGVTENYALSINRIPCQYMLALSASIPYERKLLLNSMGFKKTLKVTLPQAIRYGIIPPVHIIGVEIDPDLSMDFEDIELRRFKGVDKEHPADVVYDYEEYMYIAQQRNYFFHKAFTVTNCSLKQRLNIIEKELAFWRSKMDDYPWTRETRFLPLGGMRKTILANYKNSFMPHIQKHLQGKRYVVFNENIEQIESNDGTSVHSKIKKKTNLEAIEDFNSGKVDVLQVAKMLNEGINLKNIDAVVILALTTESVQNIQRRGRSVRGDNPTVYALYVKGTKDEINFKEFAKDYKDNLTLMKIEDLFT